MIKRHWTAALCVACFAMTWLSGPAFAWGKTGHRVTGKIAEQYLSCGARNAIAAILGVEDLAESSTWVDFMRASPDAFWQDTAGPYHYVTIPVGKTYSDVGAPPEGDAISAMAGFRATLQDDGASIQEKQLALRFLVHVIGDLHQPLHAGNGTDRGGNDNSVIFFGRATNLHHVWDDELIDHEGLSYSEMAEWLSRRIAPEQVTAWSQTDAVVWVTEGTAIRDRIYPDRGRELRWDYIYQHRAILHERLSQAGVRMAVYLNDLFKRESAACTG